MHITITGKLGSGKSTVCKLLRDRYGYEIFSTGTILRQIATDRGIELLELNKKLNHDPKHEIDNQIDSTTVKISTERAGDKIIFDSRMAWHFAKDTFKVFVTVAPAVAGARVFANQRGAEETYSSAEEATEKLIKRSEVEQERFINFYGVDYYDYNNYNLVVDSSNRTPEEIADIIWNGFEAYQADPAANRHKEFL